MISFETNHLLVDKTSEFVSWYMYTEALTELSSVTTAHSEVLGWAFSKLTKSDDVFSLIQFVILFEY